MHARTKLAASLGPPTRREFACRTHILTISLFCFYKNRIVHQFYGCSIQRSSSRTCTLYAVCVCILCHLSLREDTTHKRNKRLNMSTDGTRPYRVRAVSVHLFFPRTEQDLIANHTG